MLTFDDSNYIAHHHKLPRGRKSVWQFRIDYISTKDVSFGKNAVINVYGATLSESKERIQKLLKPSKNQTCLLMILP